MDQREAQHRIQLNLGPTRRSKTYGESFARNICLRLRKTSERVFLGVLLLPLNNVSKRTRACVGSTSLQPKLNLSSAKLRKSAASSSSLKGQPSLSHLHADCALINKSPPLNRGYNRDPNIRLLKGGGLLIMGLQYSVENTMTKRREIQSYAQMLDCSSPVLKHSPGVSQRGGGGP